MAEAPSNRCPRCGGASPTRLADGQWCAACRSASAWKQQAGEKLVIGREDIAHAELRRAGEAAGESFARRLLVRLPVIISIGLTAAAVISLYRLWQPVAIGPLDGIERHLHSVSNWTLVSGIAAFVLGLVFMLRLRRQRQFRALSFLVPHTLAVVAGVVATGVGGLAVIVLSGGSQWQYNDMPERKRDFLQSEAVARIAAATAVVVAPDKDGNAKIPSLGAGAVIYREQTRAWLVTNSHVALPYESPSSFREVEGRPEVWVQFSDGRGARGAVRWVAQPPIDVAILEVAIDNPPPAIPIASDSVAATTGTEVTFVPNPYRSGWRVERGQVTERRTHQSPAGDYSIVHTDLPVLPGDSGSGLYNEFGELIGLNTWTRLEPRPAGISLPSEAMRAIARAIEAGDLALLRGDPN